MIKEEEEEEEEEEKWLNHYSNSQRMLLVGEGDFSFSLCLAKAFGVATNMVSTSIDTQDSLAKKYTHAIGNVRELEEKGCLVLLGVDATQMSQHFFLKTQRFDRIIYNFPHVGFLHREDSYCQIQLNKGLVKKFLKGAKELMKKTGEIHVTHKMGEPYDKWEIEKKAAKIGLALHESVPFRKQDYPGYANKRAHVLMAALSVFEKCVIAHNLLHNPKSCIITQIYYNRQIRSNRSTSHYCGLGGGPISGDVRSGWEG